MKSPCIGYAELNLQDCFILAIVFCIHEYFLIKKQNTYLNKTKIDFPFNTQNMEQVNLSWYSGTLVMGFLPVLLFPS